MIRQSYVSTSVGDLSATANLGSFCTAEYVKPQANELQMVFTFEHMDVDGSVASPFKPRKFKVGISPFILCPVQFT